MSEGDRKARVKALVAASGEDTKVAVQSVREVSLASPAPRSPPRAFGPERTLYAGGLVLKSGGFCGVGPACLGLFQVSDSLEVTEAREALPHLVECLGKHDDAGTQV